MNYALDLCAICATNEGVQPVHVHPFTDWMQLEPGVVTLVPNRVEINLFIAKIMEYLIVHPKVYFLHDVSTFDVSFFYTPGTPKLFSHKLSTVSLSVSFPMETVYRQIDRWAKSDDCVYVVREIAYTPACVNVHAMCLGNWANVNGAVRNLLIDKFLAEDNEV